MGLGHGKLMNTTLRELKNSEGALQRLAAAKFPARIAWRIGRITDKALPLIEKYNAQHEATVKANGAQVEGNPNLWQVLPEKALAVTNELNELLDEVITIDRALLTLADLGDYEITPTDCAALSWLIIEEAETPKALGASAD